MRVREEEMYEEDPVEDPVVRPYGSLPAFTRTRLVFPQKLRVFSMIRGQANGYYLTMKTT